VKLVDPSGEMLDPSWESHATLLANCTTVETLLQTFFELVHHLHIDLGAVPGSVVYARDTRASGSKLVAAFEAGLGPFVGLKTLNLGVQTTPVLHYVVRATNARAGEQGRPTVEGYYERMAGAFRVLIVS
jgi:phosphoacetylglucosamine mutase